LAIAGLLLILILHGVGVIRATTMLSFYCKNSCIDHRIFRLNPSPGDFSSIAIIKFALWSNILSSEVYFDMLEIQNSEIYVTTKQKYGELVHICNWRLNVMQVVAGLSQCADGEV